ncbi:MAG: hypothetical protein O2797_02525 [Bacteroidetes bacterium]|nr:hypothetical protein [Bacteroidota bacterium]
MILTFLPNLVNVSALVGLICRFRQQGGAASQASLSGVRGPALVLPVSPLDNWRGGFSTHPGTVRNGHRQPRRFFDSGNKRLDICFS